MQDEAKRVVCRDKEGQNYEVDIKELSFRPSVYGVIIQDNKILLATQTDWEGYDFPGGGVDLGETLEEALKREVKEETGLEVAPNKILAVENSFFKLPYDGSYVQAILIYYACEIIGGKISKNYFPEDENELAAEPEWIDLEKLDDIRFYNTVNSLEIIEATKK